RPAVAGTAKATRRGGRDGGHEYRAGGGAQDQAGDTLVVAQDLDVRAAGAGRLPGTVRAAERVPAAVRLAHVPPGPQQLTAAVGVPVGRLRPSAQPPPVELGTQPRDGQPVTGHVDVLDDLV